MITPSAARPIHRIGGSRAAPRTSDAHPRSRHRNDSNDDRWSSLAHCCCHFYVTLAGYIGLATLVALGLVLLTGISGQTSFGQASFVGLAAYATTLLTKFAGQPPIVGLLAGLLVTGVIAWLLGLITARLSGHFLALVSVAWGISFFSLFGTLPRCTASTASAISLRWRLGPFSAANQRINLARHPRRRRHRHDDVVQPARQPHRPRHAHAQRRASDG